MTYIKIVGKIYNSNQNSVKLRLSISVAVFFLFLCSGMAFGTIDPEVPFLTPLRSRGFSLIPAPQQVELGGRDVVVNGSWAMESKVGTEDIAVKRLIQGAAELHGLALSTKGWVRVVQMIYLYLPEIPLEVTLKITPKFSESYNELIVKAENMKVKNDDLVNRLTRYVGQVERNRYNMEVYLSIAYLERYFINTVLTLRDAESLMLRAQSAASEGKPRNAVANLVEADHRKGLDYLIDPFQRMNLPGWRTLLNERINTYAAEHKVPVRGLEEKRLED